MVLISLVLSMLTERNVLWEGNSSASLYFFCLFICLFSSLLRTSLWNLEDPVPRKMIHRVRHCTLVLLCVSVCVRVGGECNPGKFVGKKLIHKSVLSWSTVAASSFCVACLECCWVSKSTASSQVVITSHLNHLLIHPALSCQHYLYSNGISSYHAHPRSVWAFLVDSLSQMLTAKHICSTSSRGDRRVAGTLVDGGHF